MCMENSDDDSIDTATDVNEEVIDTEPLKQEEKFACDLCDFVSNRPYGLVIHKGRKHKNGASSLVIGQFDGNDTINDAKVGNVTVNEEIASKAEADSIDVDKSADVVETPEDLDLSNMWDPVKREYKPGTKILIKPGQKTIWIGGKKHPRICVCLACVTLSKGNISPEPKL